MIIHKRIKKQVHNSQLLLVNMLALGSAVLGHGAAFALPTDGEFNLLAGDASYDASQAEIDVREQRSVFEFTGNGWDINAGETLNVNSAMSGIVALGLDRTGAASQINGSLAGNVNLILLNNDGIMFGQQASVSLPSLIATTYDVDQTAFRNGDPIVFSSNPGSGSIIVRGLDGAGAEHIMLMANDIDVLGNVELADGVFSAVAGGEVTVTYGGNNLFQYDVTQALSTNRNQRVIDVAAGASVSAQSVHMEAWVSDAKSFAINVDGVVEATGITFGSDGSIVLNGRGGRVKSGGSLLAQGSADISITSVETELGGNVQADELTAVIGDTGDDTVSGRGKFSLVPDTRLQLSRMTVIGSTRSSLNEITGLANYHVTGLNSGTAAYDGVGGASGNPWENVGTIAFNNIGRLFSTSKIGNTLIVEENGKLQQQRNGVVVGSLSGGTLNDTFIIAGELEFIDGSGGDDTITMNSGEVFQRVSGGDGIDTLNGVLEPNIDMTGFAGSSQFVNAWIDIENVVEREVLPPVPIIDPPDPVFDPAPLITPQTAFLDISELSQASLGLIGSDANPKLPCGFEKQIPTTAEKTATEEDCYNEYGAPEYQALISSIIHFDNDSSAITAASAQRLDKVSKFVVDSDMFDKVVIAAHTDDNASDAYNMKLSERRANSTADYMQSQGVVADIIETHYFGESLPAVPNTSAENRAYNRRAHIDLKR